MGLDAYAYTTKEQLPDVDFDTPADAVEIHYWRKHWELHEWMGDVYFEEGGTKGNFSNANLKLTPAYIGDLEKNAEYFHERGLWDDWMLEDITVFLTKAKEALAKGLNVFYTGNW